LLFFLTTDCWPDWRQVEPVPTHAWRFQSPGIYKIASYDAYYSRHEAHLPCPPKDYNTGSLPITNTTKSHDIGNGIALNKVELGYRKWIMNLNPGSREEMGTHYN
jgi:hypothetical protein